MARIKLTSKRQATFPVEVCRQLGVGPGDTLELDAIRHRSGTRMLTFERSARRLPQTTVLGSGR